VEGSAKLVALLGPALQVILYKIGLCLGQSADIGHIPSLSALNVKPTIDKFLIPNSKCPIPHLY